MIGSLKPEEQSVVERVKIIWVNIADGPCAGGKLQIPAGSAVGAEVVMHYAPLDIETYEDDHGEEHYIIHSGGQVLEGPVVYKYDGYGLVFDRMNHNPVVEDEDFEVVPAGPPVPFHA